VKKLIAMLLVGAVLFTGFASVVGCGGDDKAKDKTTAKDKDNAKDKDKAKDKDAKP